MNKRIISQCLGVAGLAFLMQACSIPTIVQKSVSQQVPESFADTQDTTTLAAASWRDFFPDPNLQTLIDTALANNQELNIMLQEIEMSQNEIMAAKGEYLPFVNLGGAAGVEKVGRYTSQGANDANTEIRPGKEFPDPLPDFMLGASASWEVDIWKKLRTARQSAVQRYLASREGRNFMVTNLVSEIAQSYFELMALDNQLDNLRSNIQIQQNALEIVRMQKNAARATELAVRKFEAEVLKNRSLQWEIQQRITETENRINFLVGRYPQPVVRSSQTFQDLVPAVAQAGVPSQLMLNRPDIRQAELDLAAAKLDVFVARANFYPSLRLTAGLGFQAFNPKLLVSTPESMIFSLAGDIVGPLINRNAIKAMYYNANARQTQAVYNYERSVLGAYIEVMNQLAKIDNLGKSYDLRSQQVEALTQSITIANNLFRSARADYMEVLLTQRDALESKMELIETKKDQLNASVNLYRALGGGWK